MSKTNGDRFIDRLVAASPTERRKVTVLGQDIYFKPLTRKEMVDAMPKDNMDRPPDYAGLFMIVQLAEAEDGTKLFKMADIEALRAKVSVNLVHQLEQAMMGVQTPTLDQVAKEAAADPPFASA